MAKTLVIGNESFEYPDPGDNPGWGESATDWSSKVTDVLSTLSGPNDILLTTANILDNQSSSQNVQGLLFSAASVKSFETTYVATRTDGSTTYVETGKIYGSYNGSSWDFSIQAVGDAGLDFDITAAGQVKYFSSSIGGTYSGSIKFKASTIAV